MSEHTPGPWDRVDISTGCATKREQINHNGYAAVQIQHDGSAEGDSNARLIAASPAMLNALCTVPIPRDDCDTDEGMLAFLDEFLTWWDNTAKPAISKATEE